VKLKCHVYPVPDMSMPFLGIHYTMTADGKCKIGPNAVPIFGRERYDFFSSSLPNAQDLTEIVSLQSKLFWENHFGFRKLAFKEFMNGLQGRMSMISAAQTLVDLPTCAFDGFSVPGIRAQLVDLNKMSLEMDFVMEGDASCTHLLNAVSPAWTCSIPLASYLVDKANL